jgi:hypothetical protein
MADGDGELPPHELEEFLHQDQAEIAAEYERIFRRSTEDPGTAGDEGEENWAALFRSWLPDTYQVVTKGRIVFPDKTATPDRCSGPTPWIPASLIQQKTLSVQRCRRCVRVQEHAEGCPRQGGRGDGVVREVEDPGP